MRDVLVIGAGAAGVSAAAALRGEGIDALILERDEIGSSWRHRYDRLRLNSTRRLSSLPHLPIPRENGRWVEATEYHRYLRRYADRLGLEVRFGVSVERIDGAHGGFRVHSSDGDFKARLVVVATGYDREPRVPDWPGLEDFERELLHSDSYRRPASFRGRRVLVVGAGNSGMEIALDLAEGGAAAVQLAVRTPPILLAHEWYGIPVTWFGVAGQPLPERVRDLGTRLLSRAMFGDLERFGLPESCASAVEGAVTELEAARGRREEPERRALLERIVNQARQYEQEAEAPTLPDFLARTVLEAGEGPEPGASLTLATFHGAKGGEWRRVWMAGLCEGILPHARCSEGEALEEERRLCYVGMTRAAFRSRAPRGR